MRYNFLKSAVIGMTCLVFSTTSFAASDVSNSPTLSNKATGSTVASIASSQTTSIVSAAATGGFSTSGSGGFTSGGSGGFSTGGSGGFNSGDSAPAPSGTGGSGGFGAPAAPGTNTPDGAPVAPDKGANLFNLISGRAAGDGDNANAIWIQTLGATIRRTEMNLGMHGLVLNGMAGFDHHFDEDFLAGVAVGFEHDNISTTYNHGYYRTNGYTLAPYSALTLNPKWTLDGTIGYSFNNYSTATQGQTTTGSFDGGRWMASSNLTGGFTDGNWRYQPKLGLSFSREMQNSDRDNTGTAVDSNAFSLGSLTGGGKMGYDYDGVLPYVKALAEWDFKHPDAVAKSNGEMSEVTSAGGVGGFGVEVSKDQMTASLEVDNSSILRRDTNVWALIGRLHVDF